ncbi:MAG: DUF2793 domain-containing protein [Actinomycetota bacterium]|nr:DUF2793 domain-containing protein [Actinomycetota bacterium]
MTGASSAAAAGAAGPAAWPWPVDLERCHRQGQLSVTEVDGLRVLGLELLRCADRDLGSAPWRAVRKLVQPLDDARSALHWHPDNRHQRRFARDAAALVLTRCAELGRPYWTWPAQDWAGLIGAGAGELRQSWPGQVGSSARPYLLAYAYLLGGFTAFDRVGRFHRQSLASRVFGKDPVDDAIGQIRDVLAGWGYHRRCERDLTSVICHVLLLNRSPRLEDLSSETLARLRTDPAMGQYFPGDLHGVHRAVAALGHAEPPAAPKYGDGPAVITGAAGAWAGWVERWHATSTLAPVTRGIYRVVLAKMGRWLAGEHPEITEPAHWTRQTCASWVAAVDRMAVGDYSQSLDGKRGRVGEPLSPKTKSSYLRMARAFFRPARMGVDPPQVRPGQGPGSTAQPARPARAGPPCDRRRHLGQDAVGRAQPGGCRPAPRRPPRPPLRDDPRNHPHLAVLRSAQR